MTTSADRNIRAFLLFRVFFNSRFYYPVLAVLFLDLGLSLQQYTLLNVAWAGAIVLFEVPSGALADMVGRKKFVVAASILMVIEMLVFGFSPTKNPELLFWIFMLNRLLSGTAEAFASGADEALLYDSLKSEGRESEWGSVLDRLNKFSAVGFFIVMIVGAAAYDAHFLNSAGGFFGLHWNIAPADVVRVPVYLTLISAFVTCYAALSMREPPTHQSRKASVGEAFRKVLGGGRWILGSPVAFFVILATLANDSFLRLFMTFSSQYFRLIHLPEITFGIVGALIGLVGYTSPAIAKRMIRLGSEKQSFLALSIMSFVGLAGLQLAIPYLGLVFVFTISIALGVLGYLTSYYLNSVAGTDHRATVLSFNGLTTHLAYGTIGIFFASLLKSIQHREGNMASPDDFVFARAIGWLPWSFLGVIATVYIVSRVYRVVPANGAS